MPWGRSCFYQGTMTYRVLDPILPTWSWTFENMLSYCAQSSCIVCASWFPDPGTLDNIPFYKCKSCCRIPLRNREKIMYGRSRITAQSSNIYTYIVFADACRFLTSTIQRSWTVPGRLWTTHTMINGIDSILSSLLHIHRNWWIVSVSSPSASLATA